MGNVVSSKVKWMRGLAFAFIIVDFVLSFFFRNTLLVFFANTFGISSSSDSYDITDAVITFSYLVFAGLMTYLAAIKANRIYAIILIAQLIRVSLRFIEFPESMFWLVFIPILRIFLTYLIPLYGFSVILQNNYSRLDIKTQKWLPLILAPSVLSFTIHITYSFCYNYILDIRGLENAYNMWENMIYFSPLYAPWYIIMYIMVFVATFKLIYSPAFGGNYNPNVKGDFNPLNKYFLGSLGAVAIGVAGLSALYYFGL